MRTVLALLLALITLAASATPRATLYVSPRGNDRWTGKLPAPNAGRTDGPVATVQRAQEAARRHPGATVFLRGGTYRLRAPLLFTPEDSGTTYAAFRDEKPVLSGGVRLAGGKVDRLGRWVFPIPDAVGGTDIRSLYVNGHRRFRPRLPKAGYFHIDKELSPAAGDKPDRFGYRGDDIRADWSMLPEVEVLAFHQWTMQRLRVKTIDAANHTVTFTGPTWDKGMAALGAGDRYLVENVKEALSQPGEFYVDRLNDTITYLPKPGERLASTEVVVPRLDALAGVRGDPASGKPVTDLTLRGLSFQHTAWNIAPGGHSFPQAEMDLGAAVRMALATRCRLDKCSISHVDEYALDLQDGCKDCSVTGCDLTDLGGGGVRIGRTDMPKDATLLSSGNIVQDCRIAHGGRIHPAAVGVWIGQSPYNLISHNGIEDFYYTGVSVGWDWGYGPSGSHHNTIEYNAISNIGQAVLSDLGGIYTLGLSPGSVLRGNVIHDCDSDTYGGWGIYFDEGTSGMLAENNLVYHTKTGGFHQHYGENNVLRNNIFALSRESQLQRTRMEDHLSFTFEHNIVYYRQGVLLGSNWGDTQYNMDSNLYWNAKGSVLFLSHPLNGWQKDKGKELHSLVADPLFVGPQHGDFHLKSGSPAPRIGFKPWDYTKAGPRVRFPNDAVPAAFPVTLPTYE